MVRASVTEFNFGTHRRQQVARGLDIPHLRNVFENDRLIRKQRCGHAGKGGIFCPAYAYGAQQRFSAADDELIHERFLRFDCNGTWAKELLTGLEREDKSGRFN
jgi:hypothetical protein